jgi:NADH:ubiquinone oxidoreductase subunit 6 (subunit J)
MTDALFFLFAAALLGFSIAVVLARNLYRAAYALAGALATTAALYVLLSAPLLGAIQLLLYTGGVLTLVVFALVLTESVEDPKPWRKPLPGALAAAAVFGFLAPWASLADTAAGPPGLAGARAAGASLFRDYAVAFELLSLLLLAALLGALVIARKETPS